MAVFDDTQLWPDKLLLYFHEIKWQNNIPVPAKAEPERVKIPEAEPLYLECKHFLDCISNGHKPLTDGREGLRVQTKLDIFPEEMKLRQQVAQQYCALLGNDSCPVITPRVPENYTSVWAQYSILARDGRQHLLVQ